MSFKVEKREQYTLITVNVEKLDGAISPELKSVLVLANSDGACSIILDLSATRYCDSSGLSAILVGNRLCNNSNGSFVICGIQDAIMKLIVISQLDSILNLTPTFSEAEQYLFMEEVERGLENNLD